MKKLMAYCLCAVCLLALCGCAADKMVSLAEVKSLVLEKGYNGMDFEDTLFGRNIKDIRKTWGKPDSFFTEPDADIWYLTEDETSYVALYYNESGKTDYVLADVAVTMRAQVVKTENGTMLVKPVDGSAELSSSDLFSVNIKNAAPSPEPESGDTVEIVHSSDILETYPAMFGKVYRITVIEKAPAVVDRIPMIRAEDGELYLDTGIKCSVQKRPEADVYITLSEVPQNEEPSVPGQSNFTAECRYRYGEEGTIEVEADGEWRIFATESKRLEIQFGQ